MQDFYRSLRYLKPYRKRIALSILCVVFISVLWGGGLGLLGPAGKILISDEGLHGWAYIAAAEDRLGISMSHMAVPHGTQIAPDEPLTYVLSVHKVKGESPAHTSGLATDDWIIGLDDGDPEHRILSAVRAAGIIAHAPPGAAAALRVVNRAGDVRTVAIDLAQPHVTSRLLMEAVSLVPEPQTRADKFQLFLGVIVFGLLVTYLRDFFRFVQEYLVSTAVVRGIMDIRCEAYDVSLRLPMTFFSQKGTTDTMSRFVKDTNLLTEGQITLFGKTLAEPGKAIASIAAAMMFSWKLTLLALVAGPPSAFLIRKFGKQMRRASKKALMGWSSILAVLEETLNGIRVVKAYTMEGTERRRFFRANRQLYHQQKRMAWI